jgi:predicted metal-dependent hydrolase
MGVILSVSAARSRTGAQIPGAVCGTLSTMLLDERTVVRRSTRARRVRLSVGPLGEAIVTLPSRAPESWAHELVADRLSWLTHHRTRLAARHRRLAARPRLGEGRPIHYGGVPHELRIETVPRRRSRVEHDDTDAPTLRLFLASGDERPLGRILEPWLRAEARAAIERRVAVRAPALGLRAPAFAVRDQRTRWGSASRRGRLSFSWRLVLCPPVVLDYVVVHELAHLRDFSHSPRYWSIVRGICPDTAGPRRWLREHEADLRGALDP